MPSDTPSASRTQSWPVSAPGDTRGDRPLYQGLAARYPDEWARFVSGVPEEDRGGDLLDEAYGAAPLLDDPDEEIRERAARNFTAWELATATPGSMPPPRWLDPAYQIARSRIVTHYFTHDCWIDNGSLLDDATSFVMFQL